MGLGKTVQTLAVILSNRADKKTVQEYSKTTLIVAPLAVVAQWEAEARSKCDSARVLTHHGAARTRDATTFAAYDIVVTSYQTVASEHRVYADVTTPSSKSGGKRKKPLCALFEARFLRIVLDEAQNIKNRTSKTSIACTGLTARFRWCLTGTPIQNNVDELYALLRFLRIVPFSNYDEFKARISTPMKSGRVKVAIQRLQLILKLVMLRRTKTTLNDDGTTLITLPPKHIRDVQCTFDAEEQRFYDNVHTRAQQTISKFVTEGEINSRYTSVLTLLLRLRQACCHPHLVTRAYSKDDFVANDVAGTMTASGKVEEEEEGKAADELADLFNGLGVGEEKHVDDELQIEKGGSKDDALVESAKIRAIMSILKDIHRTNGADKKSAEGKATASTSKYSENPTQPPPKPARLDPAGLPSKTIEISSSDDDDLDTIIKRTASMDIKKADEDGKKGDEKSVKKKKSVMMKKQRSKQVVLSDSDDDEEHNQLITDEKKESVNNDTKDTKETRRKDKTDKKDTHKDTHTDNKANINTTTPTQVNNTPEKTIIFSQFVTFLDIIESFVKAAGYKYVRCEW